MEKIKIDHAHIYKKDGIEIAACVLMYSVSAMCIGLTSVFFAAAMKGAL